MKINDTTKVLAIFAGLGFPALSPLPASPDTVATTAIKFSNGESVPEGLTPSEWAGIRGAHEAWKHRFAESDDGKSFSATNPGQQWRTVFDGRGFTAEPHDHSWRWGLELTGYGFGEDRHPVSGQAKTEATGTRLSYRWDEILEEWFRNDGRGLEQGWTLSERPTGAGDDETLRLDLAVRGDLRPAVGAEGGSVNFVSNEGATALTYGGLKAWDATGRPLPARFLSRGDGIAVEVDERGAAYPVTIDPIAQQAYLKASNTGGLDLFGWSVAVSGDTVVVGAYLEDSSTTGVNSVHNDDGMADDSGAAYVFIRNAGIWSQQAYLKPFNTQAGDGFGASVAVSGDTLVVGANLEDSNSLGVNSMPNDDGMADDSGAAYVFTRNAGIWSQQAYLKASNTDSGDNFGWSVSISGDTVVVGAYLEDSSTMGVNSVPNEMADGSGAAYVFTRSGMIWSQQAYLKASNTGERDEFGQSVAVSGDTVVVGAYGEDSNTTGVDSVPDDDGTADDSGAVYVFTRSGMTWSQQAYLKAFNTGADDYFGLPVAVSGDTVVVAAYQEDSSTTGVNSVPDDDGTADDSGAAYVFSRNAGIWSQQAYLKASNTGGGDYFGQSVAVSGNTVVVGAVNEDSSTTGVNSVPNDDGTADFSGAAYVFTRSAGIWSHEAYLKAFNPGFGDGLGVSVAISGDTVVAGAFRESSSTTGVNSVPDELAMFSGAAYLFTIPSSRPTSSSSPPTLRVTGKKRITTSRSRYILEGTAEDADGDLARVEARDFRPNGRRKYRTAKGTARWRYNARLKSGRNTVKIRAVDATGRMSGITRVTIFKR